MKEKKKWNELSKKSQKALSITAFLIFILFSLFLFIMVGVPMVKHATDAEAYRTWIDSMGIWGRIAFIGMNILQVLVAVIPGGPLEVAGGYAFGHFEAMILCTIGMGIGSALVFLLVRYFGYKLVEAFFPVEKINEQGGVNINKYLAYLALCNSATTLWKDFDIVYDYIYRKLVDGNIHKDREEIEEALSRIREMRDTWKEVMRLNRLKVK